MQKSRSNQNLINENLVLDHTGEEDKTEKERVIEVIQGTVREVLKEKAKEEQRKNDGELIPQNKSNQPEITKEMEIEEVGKGAEDEIEEEKTPPQNDAALTVNNTVMKDADQIDVENEENDDLNG